MSHLSAICFDAFGTLVEITDKRRPFSRLRQLGTRPLVENLPLRQACLECRLDPRETDALCDALAEELTSIRLRTRMAELWSFAVGLGLRTAVCSNLAADYGPAMLRLLPTPPDASVMSYLVGAAKPDPRIYAEVSRRLDADPQHILFVGDTPACDFHAPARLGFRSVPLDAFEERGEEILRDAFQSFGPYGSRKPGG